MDRQHSLGWMPDLPDIRDYTPDHPAVQAVLHRSQPHMRALAVAAGTAPGGSLSDLRAWCSPVEDQGAIGSCTANAGAGMIEYYERRAFGKHVEVSRLFLYKAMRDLMRVKGDTGGQLRTMMQTIALFGAPDEQYWPYDVAKFDVEPSAFLYAMAQNYRASTYYRLDPAGATPAVALANVKTNLLAGLPSMFGFTCYSSMPGLGAKDDGTGFIPMPVKGDKVRGGHAMLIVGHDDNLVVAGSKGALLIRNSWGPSWGNKGYGWLPYGYVLQGLASDFWSLVKADFVDSSLFA